MDIGELAKLFDNFGREGGEGDFGRLMSVVGWTAQYYAMDSTHKAGVSTEHLIRPFDAVVVLSGPPVQLGGGGYNEESPENVARIKFAVEMQSALTHYADCPITLILNGETGQLEMMQRVASLMSAGNIQSVDCGARGIANTATQFDAMLELGFKRLVAVTSGYHVARVTLTGLKRLPQEITCRVIGVPYSMFRFDVAAHLVSEARRILDYALKGDIADPSLLPSLV